MKPGPELKNTLLENATESSTDALDLKALPNYGFQFAFANLGNLKSIFLKITVISVLGGMLGFYGTYLIAELISNITNISQEQISYFYIPAFLLAYLAKEGLEYLTRRDGEAFPTLAANRFKSLYFSALLKSDPATLANTNKEELLSASERYLGQASNFLSNWIWSTSRQIAQFVIVLFILASQSFVVFGAALLYLALFLLFSLRISAKFAPFAKNSAQASQAAGSQMTQSYLAVATIRRLCLEHFFLGKLHLRFREQAAATIRAQRFHAWRWLVQLNAFNCLYIASLFLGIYQVKAGQLPLGFLVLIRYAFDKLWDIVVFIIENYVSLIHEKENTRIAKGILEPLLSSQKLVSGETVSNF